MSTRITGLKRVRTTNGRTYYYLNGKRVSSKVASDFQRKDSARRSKIAKESAKNLLYYKGRALKKDESAILKRFSPNLPRNIDEFYKSRAEIQRTILQSAPEGIFPIFQTERGAFKNGYTGEVTKKGVSEVATFLLTSAFNNYKVVLTKPNEDTKGSIFVRGAKRVLDYLAKFEIGIVNDIRSIDSSLGVKVTFDYKMTISYRTKTIFLSLQKPKGQESTSFKKEFAKGKGTQVPQLYRDVEIKIATSR
jgi:hypothetical protein